MARGLCDPGQRSTGRQEYGSRVSLPSYVPVSRITGELRKYGMIHIHFLKSSNQINEMLSVCSTEQRGVLGVIYKEQNGNAACAMTTYLLI